MQLNTKPGQYLSSFNYRRTSFSASEISKRDPDCLGAPLEEVLKRQPRPQRDIAQTISNQLSLSAPNP